MKSSIEPRGHHHLVVLGLIVLSIFIARFLMLSSSAYATGLDGYYYAIQIKSMKDWGGLIIADPSPVFSFLWIINLVANDPVLSTKLAAAFLSASLALVASGATRGLGGTRNKALMVACLVAISPTLAQLSVDYVKNLFALNMLLLSFWVWVSYLNRKIPQVGGLVLALGLSALTYLSHRLSAVVLIVFLLALFIGRYKKSKLFWFLLGGIGLLILALLLITKRGLQVLDISRVLPELVMPFSLPITSPGFFDFMPLTIALELSLTCVAFWLLFLRRSSAQLRAIKLACVILFLPIFDFGHLDLGFRLFSNALPLLFLIVVLDFDLALFDRARVAGLIALPLIFASFFVYNPRRDPPFAYYEKIVAPINLGPDDFLIAHGGLNHFYTYKKSLKYAMNFTPDFEVDPRHLWRLSYGISIEDYGRVLPLEADDPLVKALDHNYVLIREDVFQTYVAFLTKSQKADLDTWYNPLHPRPAFLRD